MCWDPCSTPISKLEYVPASTPHRRPRLGSNEYPNVLDVWRCLWQSTTYGLSLKFMLRISANSFHYEYIHIRMSTQMFVSGIVHYVVFYVSRYLGEECTLPCC